MSGIALGVSVVCLIGSCAALLYAARAARESKRLAMRARGDAVRAEIASDRTVELAGKPNLADIARWRDQQSKALGL